MSALQPFTSTQSAWTSVLPQAETQSQQMLEGQWITPEEQLKRLTVSVAEIAEKTRLVSDLADIIADYADDRALTNWYKAYTELRPFVPQKIPPLAGDIHSKIDAWRQKGLSPVLYFVPGGTLNQLETTMQTYWEQKHPGEENPLRIFQLSPDIREQYGEVAAEPHWGLMSNGIIPGSQGKAYDEQVALINALNLQCEAPMFYSTIAMMFLHKIATEESLYSSGDGQNEYVPTYTCIGEKTRNGWRLDVGSFSPLGMIVDHHDGDTEEVGMGAFQKVLGSKRP